MKVFLIILAVLAVIIIAILSIKAELTVIFDNGWTSKVRILFYEKDIKLSRLLSFLVAPDKAGKEAAEKTKQQKEEKKNEKEKPADEGLPDSTELQADDSPAQEASLEAEKQESGEEKLIDNEKEEPSKPPKKNPIQKIMDEDGVVGILLFASNLLQTVNTAGVTLIKGLHIYSLYVKMIIGGGNPADIGEKYGSICGWYYPLKGIILNQMKVDMYDDLIIPDFIAPRSEYEFQFIGSISVGLLLKVGLKAGKTFLVNYFKNR